jgi:transcriptional regulator with XRE-family HTH domain
VLLNRHAVRTIRQLSGLSLRQLARETDLAFSYLGELERGAAHNPSRDVVIRIAQGLRVPVTAITHNVDQQIGASPQ